MLLQLPTHSKVNSADYTVNSPVKTPPKERKNRYKIRCLECNIEIYFDYKKKHNLKFHHDLLRQRKSIRYNVVSAPKNPFEAAAGKSSKLSKTGVCTEVPHTALQDDGIATCNQRYLRTYVMTLYI